MKRKNFKYYPELISGSIYHYEQSKSSSSRLPRLNEHTMTNETGRSMVEMLNVLAVIGVLSIAGGAGYNTAMNKHKANEILNAAFQRAMVISAQLQRDENTIPNLAEFGDTEVQGSSFGAPVKVGEAQFKLKLENVSKEICEEIVKTAGTEGQIRQILSGSVNTTGDSDKCINNADISFVFNNDLSQPQCPSGGSTQGKGGMMGYNALASDVCYCSESNYVYTQNGCELNKEGMECSHYDKNECGLGNYCHFTAPENFKSGTGICTKITQTDFRYIEKNIGGWWGAYSYCLGQGMHLPTMAELEIGLFENNHNVCYFPDSPGYESNTGYTYNDATEKESFTNEAEVCKSVSGQMMTPNNEFKSFGADLREKLPFHYKGSDMLITADTYDGRCYRVILGASYRWTDTRVGCGSDFMSFFCFP